MSVRLRKRRGTYEAHLEVEALYSEGKKRCARCGDVKELSEFRTRKLTHTIAHESWCRACMNEYSRVKMIAYSKRPEVKVAKAAREAVYDKTPERMAAHRERGRERYKDPAVRANQKAYELEYRTRPGVREAMNAKSHRWVLSHPDDARASWLRFAKSPRGRLSAKLIQHNRRARLASVASTLTRDEWTGILAAFRGCCAYCGAVERITMDHVVPISRDGEHTAGNIVPACFTCNTRKSTRTIDEFLELNGLSVAKVRARFRRAGRDLA
jgi:5-methylcytosine-specific restriction endonuclease McrA